MSATRISHIWKTFLVIHAVVVPWVVIRFPAWVGTPPSGLWGPHLLSDPYFLPFASLALFNLVLAIALPRLVVRQKKALPPTTAIAQWALATSATLDGGLLAYFLKDASFLILFGVLACGVLLRTGPRFSEQGGQ